VSTQSHQATCSRLCKFLVAIPTPYAVTDRLLRTKKILDDNPELAQKWTSLIPQGTMGRPEDLMGAVTFLLSDASAYVTGESSLDSFLASFTLLTRSLGADLRVDGGYTLT